MQKSFNQFFTATGLACAMSLFVVACGKKISSVSTDPAQNREGAAAESNKELKQQEPAASTENVGVSASQDADAAQDAHAAQNVGELSAEDIQKREEILAQMSPLPEDLDSLPKAPIEGTPAEFDANDVAQAGETLSLVDTGGLPTLNHFTPTSGAGRCLVQFSVPQDSLRAGCFAGKGGGTEWVDISSDSTKTSSHACVRNALTHWHTKCVTNSDYKVLQVEYSGYVNTQKKEVSSRFWASDYCMQQVLVSLPTSTELLKQTKSFIDYWGMSYYGYAQDQMRVCAARARQHLVFGFGTEARCFDFTQSRNTSCSSSSGRSYLRKRAIVNGARIQIGWSSVTIAADSDNLVQ